MAQTYSNQLPDRITAVNSSVKRTRKSFRALKNSCRNRPPVAIKNKRSINAQTARCPIISSAGTALSAFQYMGPRPQIRKADPAYKTPIMDSDVNLGCGSVVMLFFGIIYPIQGVQCRRYHTPSKDQRQFSLTLPFGCITQKAIFMRGFKITPSLTKISKHKKRSKQR